MNEEKKYFPKRTINLANLIKQGLGLATDFPKLAASLAGFGPIDKQLRERIMLSISHSNNCRYCVAAHTEFARLAGLDENEIAHLSRTGKGEEACHLDERLCLAIEYAIALVANDFAPPKKMQKQAELKFSAKELSSIRAISRGINIANLTGNTVDMLLGRIGGKYLPVEDSSLAEELLITIGWAHFALPISLALSPIAAWHKLIRR